MTCSVEGCDKPTVGRGACRLHYSRLRRNGHPGLQERPIPARDLACSVEECVRVQRARGWCILHYTHWSKTGDPRRIDHPTFGMTPEQRLLHYTRKTDGCWLWEGAKIYSGYGSVCWSEFETPFVHRIAYMLWVGPIPPGLEIDHLCSVRNCVRPDHLEVVSRAENNRRRWAGYREAHPTCPRCGTDNWSYSGPKRRRSCNTCVARWRAAKRAESK